MTPKELERRVRELEARIAKLERAHALTLENDRRITALVNDLARIVVLDGDTLRTVALALPEVSRRRAKR